MGSVGNARTATLWDHPHGDQLDTPILACGGAARLSDRNVAGERNDVEGHVFEPPTPPSLVGPLPLREGGSERFGSVRKDTQAQVAPETPFIGSHNAHISRARTLDAHRDDPQPAIAADPAFWGARGPPRVVFESRGDAHGHEQISQSVAVWMPVRGGVEMLSPRG
jgi:hypothetical protein